MPTCVNGICIRDTASNEDKRVIIEKYKKCKPRDEKELRELFTLLCYNNLSYCCGLKKACPWRDIVRAILDISDKSYEVTKNLFGRKLAFGNTNELLGWMKQAHSLGEIEMEEGFKKSFYNKTKSLEEKRVAMYWEMERQKLRAKEA